MLKKVSPKHDDHQTSEPEHERKNGEPTRSRISNRRRDGQLLLDAVHHDHRHLVQPNHLVHTQFEAVQQPGQNKSSPQPPEPIGGSIQVALVVRALHVRSGRRRHVVPRLLFVSQQCSVNREHFGYIPV